MPLSYLDPGHTELLQLLHLCMRHLIELRRVGRNGSTFIPSLALHRATPAVPTHLVLNLGALEVVHVAVAVEEVALQGCPGLGLGVPGSLGIMLVEPVTVVPMHMWGDSSISTSVNTQWLVLQCLTDQLEPWGSQGPRHTQQNSALHVLQIMWLQPPFFSMVAWQWGHS